MAAACWSNGFSRALGVIQPPKPLLCGASPGGSHAPAESRHRPASAASLHLPTQGYTRPIGLAPSQVPRVNRLKYLVAGRTKDQRTCLTQTGHFGTIFSATISRDGSMREPPKGGREENALTGVVDQWSVMATDHRPAATTLGFPAQPSPEPLRSPALVKRSFTQRARRMRSRRSVASAYALAERTNAERSSHQRPERRRVLDSHQHNG